jgi:Ser/Thr protein kinase RdoA (MazF antagonist)
MTGANLAALAELARNALPSFGLSHDLALEVVNERENVVFRADADDGSYAVRVHRAGYHRDAELRSHAAWARALAADGVVATAPVVPTVDGDVVAHGRHPALPGERQVTVLRWVDGTLLSDTGGSDTAVYRRVGELMARLHQHAATWARPPDFDVLAWDVDGLLGAQPAWGRFWDAAALDEQGRSLLRRFRDHARAELEALGRDPERFGLVHGDFLPENLLLDADGGITLLDFDDCGEGWLLFDIATALFVPSIDESYPEVRDAFVAGYRRVAPLPDAEVERLPLFLALRAATYVGWMDTRAETRFAQEMGPIVNAGALELIADFLDGGAGG